MTQTDWNDAPNWANYVAMDECGAWYWYEDEPETVWDDTCKLGYWDIISILSKYEHYVYGSSLDKWYNTLQKRPEQYQLSPNTILTQVIEPNTSEIISTLKTYQSWRKGDIDGTLDELDLSPAKISWAIDEAIKLLEAKL